MFKRRGKKKKTAQTPAKDINPNDTIAAITKLKGTQKNLEKRVEFLRKKGERQLTMAKQANAKGQKQQALHQLKRKKILEKEITTLESSILTIEEQVLRIEGGAAVTDIYAALSLANKTMKAVNAKVDPDKLAELMNDIEDMNADIDEAADILNQPAQDLLDDADLLAELEDLGADQLEDAAFGALPSAPTKQENKEDAELLQLLRQDSADIKALEALVAPTTVPKITPPAKTKEDEELENLEALMLA